MAQWISGIGSKHSFNQFMRGLNNSAKVAIMTGQITMHTSVGFEDSDGSPQVRFAFKPDQDINIVFEHLVGFFGKGFVRQVELGICEEGRW